MAGRRAPRGALTHLDAKGRARMVEVGAKPETERVAIASGEIRMAPATARRIASGQIPKGDVLAVARLAGIQAVKQTHLLIPLCHPLRISGVEVELAVGRDRVRIRATVRAVDRTGVEMEALTAVSVAALTLYDMTKAIDKAMSSGRCNSRRSAAGAPAPGRAPAGTERTPVLAEPRREGHEGRRDESLDRR